jgi:hypothetical protein
MTPPGTACWLLELELVLVLVLVAGAGAGMNTAPATSMCKQ